MKYLSKFFIVVLALSFLVACSDDSSSSSTPQVEKLANHFDAQLADWGPTYSAQTLYEDINNDQAPFILSVRAEADYDKAHIIGAVNIPWRNVTDQTALDAANVPMDSPVIPYCYTGHTGQIATTILQMMGYEAHNLKFGMMSWWSDAANGGGDGGVAPFDYATDPPNSGIDGIETTVNELPASGTYELPDLELGNSDDVNEMARVAADKWLATDTPIISAAGLFDLLNDGDDTNDPMIISVRATAHYEAGHVTGAYNIPWGDIAKIDNLTKLDPTKEYVVYCYTGHTGQVATTALKMLGYNAKNLKFGMMGWTSNDTYMQGVGVFDANDVINVASVVEP